MLASLTLEAWLTLTHTLCSTESMRISLHLVIALRVIQQELRVLHFLKIQLLSTTWRTSLKVRTAMPFMMDTHLCHCTLVIHMLHHSLIIMIMSQHQQIIWSLIMVSFHASTSLEWLKLNKHKVKSTHHLRRIMVLHTINSTQDMCH